MFYIIDFIAGFSIGKPESLHKSLHRYFLALYINMGGTPVLKEGEQSILFVNLKCQIYQVGIRCVVSAEVTSADLVSPLAFLTQVRACVRHRTALCLKMFEIPSPSVLSGNVIISSVGRKKKKKNMPYLLKEII